jgi:enoyl-CoA hydratase/carnithine racemase
MTLQHFLGSKRASYHLYTGDPISPEAMLKAGMVNEVLPREEVLPRAWEIAEQITRMPDVARLMAVQIVRRPLRRLLTQDAGFHVAHEMVGLYTDGIIKQAAFDRGASLLSSEEA